MTKTKHYYVTGNTSKGLVNYLHTNLCNIRKVFVLNHPSSFIKSAIFKKLISSFEGNKSLEVINSPYGKEFIEGLIIREESLAFISDHLNSPNIKNTQEIFIPNKQTNYNNFQIEKMEENKHLKEAYEYFNQAIIIHDQLERVYIQEMDFTKADQIAEEFIDNLLLNVSNKNRKSHLYRRLFGTNTAEGAINIVPHIIENLTYRIFLKGRAGTGKSVFMKKVMNACEKFGFDIEIYHCSLDPDSIDMVLVPELKFCIFDSTAPHEFFPEDERDYVIDLYKDTVTPGTDEKYAEEIEEITLRYKTFIEKGMNSLKEADVWRNKIEGNFYPLDHETLKMIIEEVINRMK